MKSFFISATLLLSIAAAGCSIQSSSTEHSTNNPAVVRSAPRVIAPDDGVQFVESGDIRLDWDWPAALASNETFALRLWYQDSNPVEIWTSDSEFNASEIIDSFSRDTGPFFWQVAVIRFSEANGFESMVSEWSTVYQLNRVRLIPPTARPDDQESALARLITAKHFETTAELIDFTRNLIFEYAQDGDQAGYEPSYRDAAEQIYAAAMGQGEKPYLWCEGRSTAMLTVLEELGIASRLIFLYGGSAGSGIAQHTVLEVFNPDTQYWEIHDPAFGYYFIDTLNNGRASIERMVFGSFDTIAACDSAGMCSHEAAELYRVYYEAFRYGHSEQFWVNPDRFDVSKRFPDHDNANLAELLTGNSTEFSFRFDNWEN